MLSSGLAAAQEASERPPQLDVQRFDPTPQSATYTVVRDGE
jgi:hypothetical protein